MSTNKLTATQKAESSVILTRQLLLKSLCMSLHLPHLLHVHGVESFGGTFTPHQLMDYLLLEPNHDRTLFHEQCVDRNKKKKNNNNNQNKTKVWQGPTGIK